MQCNTTSEVFFIIVTYASDLAYHCV